jgi:hypothetical protein
MEKISISDIPDPFELPEFTRTNRTIDHGPSTMAANRSGCDTRDREQTPVLDGGP